MNVLMNLTLSAFICSLSLGCWCQEDDVTALKRNYEEQIELNNLDSAFILAKKLNSLVNSDTFKLDIISAESFLFLSNCYSKFKKRDSSILCQKKAILIFDSLDQNKHRLYNKTQHNLGVAYFYKGNLSEATKWFESVIDNTKVSRKDFDESYASSLEALAVINRFRQNLDVSGYYYKEIANYNKLIFGGKSLEYAWSLNNLGIYYSSREDYSKSLELYNRSIKILQSINKTDHEYYYACLNNIANHYHERGDFLKAKDYYLLAEQGAKDKADIHYNLALLFDDIGSYEKAESYLIKSLEIENPSVFDSINFYTGLGNLYRKTFHFSSAEDYLLKALEISLRNKLSNNIIAQCLNNLSIYYGTIGYLNKKESYLLQALELLDQETQGSLNSIAAISSNLGSYYYREGNISQSKVYYQKSLEYRKELFGEFSLEYATTLKNFGTVSDSIELVEESFRLMSSLDKNYNTEFIGVLNNLGVLYKHKGDLLKAREALDQAHKAIKEIKGQNKLRLSTNFKNKAHLELVSGNLNLADQLYLESLNLKKEHFQKYFFQFNQYDALIYKNTLTQDGLLVINYLSNRSAQDPSRVQQVSDLWFELNGMLDDIYGKFYSAVNQASGTQLMQISEKYKFYAQQLSTLREKEGKQSDTKSIESEMNKLAEQIYSLTNIKRQESISAASVQNNLENSSVFVDILPLPAYYLSEDFKRDNQRYLFIVCSSDSIYLHSEAVDTTDEIFLMSNYIAYTSGNLKISGMEDQVSYQKLWKPIADKIGDAKTVYVSLGGVYNNINLNTLYNPETGKYLIEEKDIRIVNSARDFVLMKEREKKSYSNNTAALFAYPNYNSQSSVSGDSIDFAASTRDLDPIWIDSLTRGGMTASLLPATKTEVENINTTFSDHNWQVTSYLEEDASEINIKQLNSPRVLHIATHGYFFEDIPKGYDNDRYMGMDRQQVIQDPMLRSGLLFTGANKTLQGEHTSGENGLLSAYEAALLDLSETELVVLSACETGRGEIKNSEGVYGLRKAISDAGAANTIMSLWKVDDKVTQEFMSTFYEEWLSGLTIREAFRKTQLTIKEKYPQPYYWGAFVLVGE